MKAFFDFLSVVFLSLGAIVGAGFVTGSELVAFFGADGFYFAVIFCWILTTLCFWLVFSLANRYDFNQLNGKLFENGKLFSTVNVVCNYLFFVSMLAGLDAVWDTLNVLNGLPVLSTIALFFIVILGRSGVKGLERLNLYLMPFVIVVILLCAFTSSSQNQVSSGSGKGLINSILYCFLNVFVSMPTLFATARTKSKRVLRLASIVTCIILAILSILILSVVRNHVGSKNFDMPFYVAVSNSPFSFLLIIAVVIGAFTSGASSFYPVYQTVKEKLKTKGIIVLSIMALALSRLGLTLIIRYLYPLIAGFGGVYLIKMAKFKFGIKLNLKAHNTVKLKRRKRYG